MKKTRWQLLLGGGLLGLSAVLYYINYIIFHDPHHMFLFLLEDLAFIPIEVLVVTLIIDKVIEKREKQHMMQKLNMVIGIFFTEVGTKILKECANLDPNVDSIRKNLIISSEWNHKEFNEVLKKMRDYKYSIKVDKIKLEKAKQFLISKREFLLGLLQNPNLLEHETFTDLLSAVFHLEEELLCRDISKLSDDDLEHLQNDIIRVYKAIVCEWLSYMKHIKNEYPYLFKAAVKDNPFV